MSTMLNSELPNITEILEFETTTVNLRLTDPAKSRRVKPSYAERFERAVRRLPICIQGAFNRRVHGTIPQLVELTRTELEAADPDVIHCEDDILACKRFINAYEESE